MPTANADGTAPFDTEPHVIVLDPTNAALCPADSTGIPAAAIGCIWEQISAPAGDSTDEIDYPVLPNTSYKVQLTSCSDTSGLTVFLTESQQLGCGNWFFETTAGTPDAFHKVVLTFSSAPSQLYNLYLATVYQCQFANCGTQ